MTAQLLSNEKTVLTLLDVCGSCITDVMYNFLYDRAIAVHEKTSKGLTEAYRQVLGEYVQDSNTPKFHSLLLNTIHHYVRISTIFQDISYPECISLYAGLFVPQMYIPSMTAEQRLNILTMVIGNTVREFANEILCDHIRCIIDDHQDPINVEILQDAVLKILINQRNISYDRFIQSQKENKPKTKKATAAKPLPKKSLAKLSEAFKKSIAERTALKQKNTLLTKKNKMLTNQITELKAMFLAQLASQKEQSGLMAGLKEQIQKQALLLEESSKINASVAEDTLEVVSPIETVAPVENITPIETIDTEYSNDTYDDMFSVPVQYVDDQ